MELILFISTLFVLYILFTRLLRSRLFSGLIKGAVPPPETPDEVLEAFNTADQSAEKAAEVAETEAVVKAEAATKLRGRRTTATILAEARKKK
jgi:hypothetical protein